MDLSSEQILFVVALLATLALPIWMKYKEALTKKTEELLDDVEDLIEEKTGIDVELSDAVDEVLDKASEVATEALEDIAEDGVLDSKDELVEELKESSESALEEVVDEVSEAVNEEIVERLGKMKVAELKSLLKQHGLSTGGVKAELIERLAEAGVDLE